MRLRTPQPTIEYAVSAFNGEGIIICGHSYYGFMAGMLESESVEQMPAVKS
jgi:carbonic anhydrase